MTDEDVSREIIGGYTLHQPSHLFRLGHDSIALSRFATLNAGDRVCDLGCGVGALSFLLLERRMDIRVEGIEFDTEAVLWAERNMVQTEGRLKVVPGDIRQVRALLPSGGHTLVVSNPPYHGARRGYTSRNMAGARCDAECPPEEVCAAAAWLLSTGGRFALCFPADRLTDWTVCLRAHRLEPKRLAFVMKSDGMRARLALLEAMKDARPGVKVEALPMRRTDAVRLGEDDR